MLDLLRTRRSIRSYTDKPIEPEKIRQLQEALLRSPTSRNLHPWQFIFVDDGKLLQHLSKSKPHGAAFLAGAPLGIVVLGDETISDVWVEDCSIASVLVQITAQSLGLGSCWIQIRNRMHDESRTAEQIIQDLLNIPRHFRVESIIAMGYPGEIRPGIPAESLHTDKIHQNRFNRV